MEFSIRRLRFPKIFSNLTSWYTLSWLEHVFTTKNARNCLVLRVWSFRSWCSNFQLSVKRKPVPYATECLDWLETQRASCLFVLLYKVVWLSCHIILYHARDLWVVLPFSPFCNAVMNYELEPGSCNILLVYYDSCLYGHKYDLHSSVCYSQECAVLRKGAIAWIIELHSSVDNDTYPTCGSRIITQFESRVTHSQVIKGQSFCVKSVS